MKDDLGPAPARPPAKRRTLQDRNATPEIWLHQWAVREELPPSQRNAAAGELERRKTEDKSKVVQVGVLIGLEGATPQQVATLGEWWEKLGVTEVHVPDGVRGRKLLLLFPGANEVHTYKRPTEREELREVVLHAGTLVALPPRLSPTGTVWAAVGYAKHRKVPTTVILPDGTIQ